MGLSAADRLRLRQVGNINKNTAETPYRFKEAPEKIEAVSPAGTDFKPPQEAQDEPERISEDVVLSAVSEEPGLGIRDTEEKGMGDFSEEPDGASLEPSFSPPVEKTGSALEPDRTEPVGIRYHREPGVQSRPIPVRSGSKEAKPLSLRVPASLVDMCKRSSGDTAVANSNAVAAFLYAFRDRTYDGVIDYSDVADGVVAFSRTFDVAKERAEFNKRVAGIDRNVRQLADSQLQLLWAMLYLVWDAAGFRTDHPDDPSEIGFGQSPEGFEAMMQVLDKAVKEHVEWARRKEGRPIR